jgi:hypothetical protein
MEPSSPLRVLPGKTGNAVVAGFGTGGAGHTSPAFT